MEQWLQQAQEEELPFFLLFIMLTTIMMTIPARIRATAIVPRFSPSHAVILKGLLAGQRPSADPILCIF